MKIGRMFGRWRRRDDDEESKRAVPAPEPKQPEPQPEPETNPPPESPAASPAPPDPAPAASPDLEVVRQEFQIIQEIIGSEQEPGASPKIDIPANALLLRLPEEARGPEWRPAGLPEKRLWVDREALLEQLRLGRVAAPLSELQDQLPAGWVNTEAEGEVVLDLAMIVSSLPPDLLVPEGAEMAPEELVPEGELFTPKMFREASEPESAAEPEAEAEPEPAAEPEPEPEPEPAAATEPAPAAVEPEPVPAAVEAETVPPVEPPVPPSQVAEPEPVPSREPVPAAAVPPAEPATVPGAAAPAAEAKPARPARRRAPAPPPWDGVERSLEACVHGVDVNSAGIETLAALPGLGETRARAIVEYREQHGEFKSIFDLLKVPGIGPTTFSQATGLSPRTRANRHAVIQKLLDLSEMESTDIPAIARAMLETLPLVGVVIAGADGIPLAVQGDIPGTADGYAALTTQFFRRVHRYLRDLSRSEESMAFLPSSRPPLLLVRDGDVTVIALLRSPGLSARTGSRVRRIARELAWLIGTRAVVTAV